MSTLPGEPEDAEDVDGDGVEVDGEAVGDGLLSGAGGTKTLVGELCGAGEVKALDGLSGAGGIKVPMEDVVGEGVDAARA